MKTLKEILQLEVYEPKSPDEKRFKDKHVVVKHKDANGNGDDLFNAKNIKTVDRKPEHGYNPGEDEKVYEEVEELDERVTRKLSSKEQGKIAKVMREFSKGSLKDSHGKTVTDKKQALAIAYSQMNESNALNTARRTFAAASPMGPKQPGIPPYGKPGSAIAREAAKAAAKAAATEPNELTTSARMGEKLGIDPHKLNPITIPPEGSELGPKDEGLDKRYYGGPQIGGVYTDPTTGQKFIGKWPNGVPPTSPRKPRSKK